MATTTTTTTTVVREKNTADRELGKSETNWIAAVETGTGITLLGLLFARRFTRSSLTTSLRQLLASHPRLRSRISKQLNGKNFLFTTSNADHAAEDPIVSQISLISSAANDDEEELEDDYESEEASKEKWLKLLEDEMNTPFPKEKPFAVFDMKVYELPENSSLVVFRFHSAAADVASTSPVARQFVDLLYRQVQLEEEEEEEEDATAQKKKQTTWEGSESAAAEGGHEEEEVENIELPALEKAIPQGQAQKPIWAHGVDTLGYGIVSRKHAYLPFDHTNKPQKSRLIRASLSPKATDDLLQVRTRSTSFFLFFFLFLPNLLHNKEGKKTLNLCYICMIGVGIDHCKLFFFLPSEIVENVATDCCNLYCCFLVMYRFDADCPSENPVKNIHT
jgi:hypothetical protein